MKAPAHTHHHPEPPEVDSGSEEGIVGDVADAEPRSKASRRAHPQLSAMERFNRAFSHRFERLLQWYEARVRLSLRRPALVVTVIVGLSALTLLLAPVLGLSFFPRTDAGQFMINMKAPSGSRIE